MANPSVPRLCSSRCTGLNASNSTFPTEICLPFRSVSRPRLDWTLRGCWAIAKPVAHISRDPLRVPRFVRLRIRHEAVANLHRSESAHAAAYGLCSVHRDRTRRRPLFLGFGSLRDCRIQRWPGWAAGAQAAPADSAWPVSRSHRRQAAVEHDVSRAFYPPQDSVEVYRAGVQPRYFHPGRECGAVCHRGAAQLPPQHLRKGEYFFADRRRLLCAVVLHTAGAMDLDYSHRLLACHVRFYDYLRSALCSPGATAAALAFSRLAGAYSRRYLRQLTLFLAYP